MIALWSKPALAQTGAELVLNLLRNYIQTLLTVIPAKAGIFSL
ncbi:MAG: hypothetical protein OXJ52_08795 [Oligoflexia bacterium]|nr:hypothetical protein [Oligoflexia bacterium]